MCRSMVDIQSATAEIRRGKEEERKKIEETTGQKYNVREIGSSSSSSSSLLQGGHNNVSKLTLSDSHCIAYSGARSL